MNEIHVRIVKRSEEWLRCGYPDRIYGISGYCVGRDERECIEEIIRYAHYHESVFIYDGMGAESALSVLIKHGDTINEVMSRIEKTRRERGGQEVTAERREQNLFKCVVQTTNLSSHDAYRISGSEYGRCVDGVIYVAAADFEDAARAVGSALRSIEIAGLVLIAE